MQKAEFPQDFHPSISNLWVMLTRRFSHVYNKRRLFVLIMTRCFQRTLQKAHRFAQRAPRVLMLQGFRKGGGVTEGGGEGGSAQPCPAPAQAFFVTQWLKRRSASQQKRTMYLQMIINQRASYSQLVSKMANEILRSSRVKLSMIYLGFCII
jgi:hypothetical protein